MAGPGTPGWAVPAGEDYLVREIAALKTAQREGMASIAASVGPIVARLDAKDAALDAAVAAIAAQQVTINAQVASIAALVGQQVTGAVGNNSSAGVTLGTGAGNYGIVTFTVPAGFTVAQVAGWSSMYAGGAVASVLRTQIAGTNGQDMYAFTNAAYANASSAFTRTLTGLTAGSTFTVASVANTGASTTTAYLTTSATVTFYR